VAKPERTGVARYCSQLVRALPGVLGPDDRVTLLYRVSRLRRRRGFERIDDPRFGVRVFSDGPVRVGLRGFDVIHGPDLRIPSVPVATVSTVHDLSALELPGIAGDEFRRRKSEALADVARRATEIVCISAFTESSFLERHPEAAGRTRVVPLGISERFGAQAAAETPAVREARGLRSPYVLFVGQISARKNLRPLVEAFGRLHRADPALDLDLVLAGPVQTGGEEVLAAVERLPVAARVRRLGFVGDAELPGLYAGAAAFCFPGKGEGFGIPILEAMACGAPVVAARAGANASTAGDAGILVDPDDPEAWAAALRSLLAPSSERDACVARGRTRAARFSWHETARRTAEAYRDAAAARAPR
jgi:glycosyltransferase involved in cell wall biosynthesis